MKNALIILLVILFVSSAQQQLDTAVLDQELATKKIRNDHLRDSLQTNYRRLDSLLALTHHETSKEMRYINQLNQIIAQNIQDSIAHHSATNHTNTQAIQPIKTYALPKTHHPLHTVISQPAKHTKYRSLWQKDLNKVKRLLIKGDYDQAGILLSKRRTKKWRKIISLRLQVEMEYNRQVKKVKKK